MKEAPNGIVLKGERLYVVSWASGLKADWTEETPGSFFYIEIKDKSIHFITKKPLGALDGLEEFRNELWLVSDKKAGKLYSIDEKTGQVENLLDAPDVADICFEKSSGLLLLPLMKSGVLRAIVTN